MKFNYVVVHEDNGTYFANGLRCSDNDNLLSKIKQMKNPITIEPVKTIKEMAKRIDFHNQSFKSNGTYMFPDEPLF